MDFSFLVSGILSITWQQAVMYVVGAVLIYLAIEKGFEPSLLMPMGFGAILVNLPLSGVINQTSEALGETAGIIEWLFEIGIEASEAMPILLFIGIGAMIDFGTPAVQPQAVPVRRCCSGRYLPDHHHRGRAGLRPEGRRLHRHHRRR